MNRSVLKKYHLKIKKEPNGQCDISGPLEGYIWLFRNSDDVQDFMNDIDLALCGNFDQIYDTDYSEGIINELYWFANITPSHFEIWFHTQKYSDRTMIPLEDWKNILLLWKQCLDS